MHQYLVTLTAAALVSACAASSVGMTEPVRIDGSSKISAERSLTRMLQAREPERRLELLLAILKLNLSGTESAYEVAVEPELATFSVAAIRHQIEGLTAEEIIGLAESKSDITIEVSEERSGP